MNSVKKSRSLYFAAPVISTYALSCLVLMALCSLLPQGIANQLISWFHSPNTVGFSSTEIKSYVQLVSHVIGHKNWAHLTVNLPLLLLLGVVVEQHYGSAVVLKLIFVTAVISSLTSFFVFQTALLGASGIVFLLITLCVFVRKDSHRIPIEAFLVAIFFTTQELINSVRKDEVAQFAHIIGAGVGFCYGLWFQKHPPVAD